MALNGSLLVDQLAPVDRSQTAPVRTARSERTPADIPDDAESRPGSFDAALRESVAEKPTPRAKETDDRSSETVAADAGSGKAPSAEEDGTGQPADSSAETPLAAEAKEPSADGSPISGQAADSGTASGTETPVEAPANALTTGAAPVLGDLLKAAGVTTDADIVLEGQGGTARDGIAVLLSDAAVPAREPRPAAPAAAGLTGPGPDGPEAFAQTAPRLPTVPTANNAASLPVGNPSAAVTPELAAALQAALAEEGFSPDAAKPGPNQVLAQAQSSNAGIETALPPDVAKTLNQRPVPGFENALVRGTRSEGVPSGPATVDADAALAALDADGLDAEFSDGDLPLSSRSRAASEAGSGPTTAQTAGTSTSLAGLQGAVSGAAGRFAALLGPGGSVPADAGEAPVGLGGLEAAGAVKPDAAFATLTPQAVSEAAGPRTLSPAIVTAAGAIARGAAAGENRFSIRLDPPELGRVDVRLKIGDDGVARAHLIVERSETLDLFMRDQRNLERALEQAGVKTDAASLQFSLKGDGDGQAGFAAGKGDDDNARQAAAGEGSDAVDTAASDPSDRSHDGVLNITI
ncbi:MAG: flagellar hook-length control protein FliK [Pseudomonadota bacterium]